MSDHFTVFARPASHPPHTSWVPAIRTARPRTNGEIPDGTFDMATLAARLGAALDPSASDENGRVVVGADLTLSEEQGGWLVVRAKTTAALERALEACRAFGLSCSLETPLGERDSASDDAGLVFRSIHDEVSEFGSLHVEVAYDRAVRHECFVFGARYETIVATPAGVSVSRPTPPLEGSRRLASLFEARRAVRSTTQWADEEFTKRAVAAGVPDWPVLRALERDVGGLIMPHPVAATMRPRLLLGSALVESAPTRLVAGWSYNDFDEEDLEGREDAPRVANWPVWSWRGAPLVFVGEWAHLSYLLCDERGALWTFLDETADMRLAAGSATTFLEAMAIEETIWKTIGERAAVTVEVDLKEAIEPFARELGLRRIAEASDDLVTWLEGEGLWVRQQAKYGQDPAELRILSEDLARIVDAVRVTLAHRPGAVVRVKYWNPGGYERFEALRAAGLVGEIE